MSSSYADPYPSIQPPGQFHHVYTTEDSITAGGHFFTFNTMHLTEWARRCIHDTGGQGTNAYHSATVRQLSLMVIALQQKAPTQGQYYLAGYIPRSDWCGSPEASILVPRTHGSREQRRLDGGPRRR